MSHNFILSKCFYFSGSELRAKHNILDCLLRRIVLLLQLKFCEGNVNKSSFDPNDVESNPWTDLENVQLSLLEFLSGQMSKDKERTGTVLSRHIGILFSSVRSGEAENWMCVSVLEAETETSEEEVLFLQEVLSSQTPSGPIFTSVGLRSYKCNDACRLYMALMLCSESTKR